MKFDFVKSSFSLLLQGGESLVRNIDSCNDGRWSCNYRLWRPRSCKI